MKFSQVPALGVRACMSSSTPWSLSVLTLSVRSVLPSILSKISALQISDFSLLNRSAHTLRYRRFASILTDANARLAVEVVVSLLPPGLSPTTLGLSPTTLRQLAWRTDSCRHLPGIYARVMTKSRSMNTWARWRQSRKHFCRTQSAHPVLSALIKSFPFKINGFHADNGSEYINHRVAELLNKCIVLDLLIFSCL